MNEQEDEFFVEPEVEEVRAILDVPEAIPIYEKTVSQQPKNIALKMLEPIKRETPFPRSFKISKVQSQDEDDLDDLSSSISPFRDNYNRQQCVYQRMRNEAYCRYDGKEFFAGAFLHKNIFLDPSLCNTVELGDIAKQFYGVSNQPLPRGTAKDLLFNSEFDSGNLFAAFKVSQWEYDLVMSNDTNSIGNNQWFYFAVQGMIQNRDYTFNVVNFTKSDSLFNYGMAPVVYSLTENKQQYEVEKGWKRQGRQVVYKKGSIPKQKSRRYYYQLTFKLSTVHEKDKLLVAHSYPYSYARLQKYLTDRTTKFKDLVTRVTIGKTIANRPMEVLVITQQINKKRDNRKAVIFMGRQHPGETQGSYVCEGVIDRLLSRTKQGQFLTKNYVFYIIPMVNPDGVIFGHYRTNLLGKDLNRKWNTGQKMSACPQITAIKAFLQQLSKQREIRFIIDLHGHSKKLNSFFYGNPYQQNPEVVRIFPYVCSKLSPAIQFEDSTFTTDDYKRKAARVHLSFLYHLIHVYTFESSFYAYFKEGRKIEFTPKEYRELGSTLISALYLQLQHEIKYQEAFEFGGSSKNGKGKQYTSSPFIKMLNQLKNSRMLLETGIKGESGSESKPEEAETNQEQIDMKNISARQTTTPNATESVPRSTKISRKGAREPKEFSFNKPTRHMKFLQISHVNSILPDKYQLGLQPIKKQTYYEPLLIKSSPYVLRVNSDSQTESRGQLRYIQFRPAQIEASNLSFSSKAELNVSRQRKLSSIIQSHNRNIIFKLDMFNQSVRNTGKSATKALPLKHAYSQTMITYSKEHGQRLKQHNNRLKEQALNKFKESERESMKNSSRMFPKVDSPGREEKSWMGINQIRIQQFRRTGMKRQTEAFLTGMVKKLITQKEARLTQQNGKNVEEMSVQIERPLTIKKKEMTAK